MSGTRTVDIVLNEDEEARIEVESRETPRPIVISLPPPRTGPTDPQKTTFVSPGDVIRVNGELLEVIEHPEELHFRAVVAEPT
jgi:hypothetical protein